MIQLTLYKFGKPNNSTAIPGADTVKWETTGQLKNNTSVLNPVILLKGGEDIAQYNYVYLPNFSRYYHVTDCAWVSGLWELSCTVDVLGSFRGEILASNQYVLRSASASNPYVIDENYSAIVKVSDAGAIADLPFDRDGSFIIGCVGGGGSATGGVSYYVLNSAKMQSLISWLYEPSHYGASLTDSAKLAFNPIQYIISCKWFPYTSFYNYGNEINVKLGWWDTGIKAKPAAEVYSILGYPGPLTEVVTVDLPKHPGGVKYLYGNAFTKMYLQLPGAGEIALDSDYYIDLEDIVLSGWIDPITGAISYKINTAGGNQIVDGQIGVEIQLSQVLTNSVGSTVSAVGAVVNAFTGNWSGAINAVGSSLSSAMPAVSRTGTNGTKLATWITDRIRLRCEFYVQTEKAPNKYGSPLCANRVLANLSGFTLCGNAQISLPTATSTETDSIIETLESGVIIA